MAGKSESDISAEEEYREYICRDVYKNKECGFQVRVKTEEAAMEHARMHQEQVHGMKETSPEAERRVRESIRPVSMAEGPRESRPTSVAEERGEARPMPMAEERREARPVSMAEEQKEYTCVEPGCGFSVRARTEDEVIEQAHMHQELEHEVKESLPETRERVRGEIRTVKVPVT